LIKKADASTGCPGPHPFSLCQVIGDKNDPALAYRVGRAAAAELALVGINLNFAPVLDVNSNPKNPVIGDRSFGSDPRQVIELSERWIQGTRDAGIIPCGKHFPGHGDTDKDSHLDLPSVDRSLEQLRVIELPPFAQACRTQIESLMTAHVLYRALDAQFPATLSAAIVAGLLRRQLGYDGVVFSDDMEMKAISDNHTVEEAVALSVRADVDVLLYGHEMPRAVQAFDFLYSAAKRDPAVWAQVENSYRRITKLKQRSLKKFTGVEENKLVDRLARLNHQRWINEIYGSL
jgi:beta-N-acetylhexosaminidase